MVVLSTEPTLEASLYNVGFYLTGHSGLKGTGITVFKVVFLRKEGEMGSGSQPLPQTQICFKRTVTIKLPCAHLTSS